MNERLIYDVGAHKGEDTSFYLKKGFSVVAIEADQDLAANIRARFSEEIGSGRLRLISAAIARAAGTVEFFVNRSNSVWGTIDKEWAERNERMGAPSDIRKVDAVTFDSVLSEYGIPYYLKVDIEGADVLCLEALKSFSTRPKYVSIESNKVKWQQLSYEFELFRSLGYDRFKLVDQRKVHHQTPPSQPLEGCYLAHQFAKGCSGLFGQELPGEWLTPGDAIKTYRRIFTHYRFFGNTTMGEKIVRRIPLLRKYNHRLLPGWYDTHARHASAA